MSLFRTDIAYDPAAQERVRAWVAALRGGEHRQAQKSLRALDGLCCLGVACHVFDPRRWRLSKGEWSYMGAIGELPYAVVDAYQLRSPDGRYGPCPEADSLAAANDHGTSFAELAGLIESELAATIERRARRDATAREGMGAQRRSTPSLAPSRSAEDRETTVPDLGYVRALEP